MLVTSSNGWPVGADFTDGVVVKWVAIIGVAAGERIFAEVTTESKC